MHIDFETYSEAGYWFDTVSQRWKSVAPNKPGIAGVGAWVYSAHPSADIISLAYSGTVWIPGMPPPEDLFQALKNGENPWAWNSFFEYCIWTNVAVRKLGWPKVPLSQFRCAMARGKAWGLPGKLEKAGDALQLDILKDKAGGPLIRKLCCPRSPTKNNPLQRLTLESNPKDFSRFYEYNLEDIRAEEAITKATPPLIPQEEALWIIDQQINARGVHVDKTSLENCLDIYKQTEHKYTKELTDITNGAVNTVNELDKIRAWMACVEGVDTPSLDKAHVSGLLEQGDLPSSVRRVLEIRQVLGSASVKKLFSIQRYLADDSRIRGLFAYYGAERTGRFAGRGPQPQNMPASGPPVNSCGKCGLVQWAELKQCRKCGAVEELSQADWGIEAVELALNDVATRDLTHVEQCWGDSLTAVSGCLRGLFSAAPGKEFICSDYSAIEAVVIAALAGEEWRLEVFRTHGKIYEMSAAKISGIPFDEIMAYKRDHGQHHPLRKKIGKVAELACFGADTEVLTDSGWKRICDIHVHDRLHDGVEWVNHSGVVDRGKLQTIKMGGVTVTPDHKFYTGAGGWETADSLRTDLPALKRVTSTANLLLLKNLANPIRGGYSATCVGVHAGMSECSTAPISEKEAALGAIRALKRNLLKLILNTARHARIEHTDVGCLTECPLLFPAALNPSTPSIPATGGGAYGYPQSGYGIVSGGSPIYAPSPDGTTPQPLSTALIMIGGIIQVISDLLHIVSNKITKGKQCGSSTADVGCPPQSSIAGFARHTSTPPRCLGKSKKGLLRRKLSGNNGAAGGRTRRVYDILNCGPRSRFVIRTSHGPMIAHNSGFGGWIGAWKAFGADQFMNDDEIKQSILKWRDESPAIVELWGGQWRQQPGRWEFKPEFYGLEGAAVMAVMEPGKCFAYREITYGVKDDVLYCRLPSGRNLVYHKPRITKGTDPRGLQVWQLSFMGWNSNPKYGSLGWVRIDTYSGKLTENVVQATARDILGEAMIRLEAAGYPIVLHVHDEPCSEVPIGYGSVEEYEKLMMVRPTWAADWPIKAAGGWRGHRYRK